MNERKDFELADPQLATLKRAQSFFSNAEALAAEARPTNRNDRLIEWAVPSTTSEETLQRIANGAYLRGATMVNLCRPMNDQASISEAFFNQFNNFFFQIHVPMEAKHGLTIINVPL